MQGSALHPRIHVFPRKIVDVVSSKQTGASSAQVRRAEPKVRRCDAFIFGRTRARSIRCHIDWCVIVPNNPQGPVQTAFIPKHCHWTTSSDVRRAPRRLPGRLNPATRSIAPGRDTVGRQEQAATTWVAYAADNCAGRDEPLSREQPPPCEQTGSTEPQTLNRQALPMHAHSFAPTQPVLSCTMPVVTVAGAINTSKMATGPSRDLLGLVNDP